MDGEKERGGEKVKKRVLFSRNAFESNCEPFSASQIINASLCLFKMEV